MGNFSWIYSDTNKAMKDNKVADSYLLVPPEFQSEYGPYIKETCYDGYGHMNGYDVYALVALWNRKYLPMDYETKAHKKPELLTYVGLWSYEKEKLKQEGYSDEEIKKTDEDRRLMNYNNALKRYETETEELNDFINSNTKYNPIEDEEYLRKIGINIACYDEDNVKLKNPIKITSKPMSYESVKASLREPNQGWD